MPVDLLRDGLVRVGQEGQPSPEEDLERWAERARALGAEPAVPEPAAAATGSCGLCNERGAVVVCLQCKTPVCASDSWVMMGLCKKCLPEEQMRKARTPKLERRPDLGIKWVDD